MYHRQAIEDYPLQTYASALLFSPTGSVIRKLFQHEAPDGVTIKPGMSDSWSACLQTLEGHSSSFWSVAFSHDSTRLASASEDRTVKIWDASSVACLQALNVGKSLYSLSFDATRSCLLTDIGSINVSTPTGIGMQNVAVLQPPQYLDVGVSPDSTWITCSGNNLLWVPSEYRPSCSSVCGNTIGISVGSGRVWICSINLHT
jgi:WD40 repeat protein